MQLFNRSLPWIFLVLLTAGLFSPVQAQKNRSGRKFRKMVTPVPLNMDSVRTAIGYPGEARENGRQGKVLVRVLIDENGDYVRHELIEDPDPLLTNAVVALLPHLRFKPALNKGERIRCWVSIPFDFKLLEPEGQPGSDNGK